MTESQRVLAIKLEHISLRVPSSYIEIFWMIQTPDMIWQFYFDVFVLKNEKLHVYSSCGSANRIE